MPCRFASSGTVATSRSASRAILALNVASNFLRDLVISVLHRLRQSRTLHTLTFGPISGVHFSQWRALPKDLPPRSTVHDYLDLWSWDGTLDCIHQALYLKCREQGEREASPTAAIIDSQSVKSAE